MTLYRGQLQVLTDSQGSVIPIGLIPADVPSDGLDFDISGLGTASPSGGSFGYIKAVTVDATAAGPTAGAALSLTFPELGITRYANLSTSQVFSIPGQARRVTLTNIGGIWVSGGIQLTFWNSPPPTEITSPVAVSVASGAVTIAGTPTVAFAPGQNVSITGTPSVNISNSTVIIDPAAHNTKSATFSPAPSWNSSLVAVGQSGVIRSINCVAGNICSYVNDGTISISLRDDTGVTTYWAAAIAINNLMQNMVLIADIGMIAVPFNNGVRFYGSTPYSSGVGVIDNNAFVNIVLGWN